MDPSYMNSCETNFETNNYTYNTRTCNNEPNSYGLEKRFRSNKEIQNRNEKQANSAWPFVLLFGSLLLSLANTMLLSFVFKSMQSVEELNAMEPNQLTWNKASSSNVLESQAAMGLGKTLRFNRLLAGQSSVNGKLNLQIPHDGSFDKSSFIETGLDAGLSLLGNRSHWNTLEMATNALEINKLVQKGSSKQMQYNIETLLEIDTDRDLIVLPLQDHLSPDHHQGASHSSPIKIDELLLANGLIEGSIDKDLELQSRNSDLICKADDLIQIESKSGEAKLSIYESIRFEAPEYEFNARDLFMTGKSIKYLDDEPRVLTSSVANNCDKLRALDLIMLNDGRLVIARSAATDRSINSIQAAKDEHI